MVGKISLKSGILSGGIFMFLIALLGFFSAAAPYASAAVGDCPDANLSFSQNSYNAGDWAVLNGSNASGTWTLCIYQGNERIAVTVPNYDNPSETDTELRVHLPDDYMGQELTGVIHLNGICGNDLDGESNCRIQTAESAQDDDNQQGGEGAGTGGDGNNTDNDEDAGDAGNEAGQGGGGITHAAGSSQTVSTNVENPLETEDFTELVTNFLQWLLGIAGSIALLMLIYGGVVYISSAGDPQKAETGKRIVMWTLFGLIIVLASYSILSTVEDIFVN